MLDAYADGERWEFSSDSFKLLISSKKAERASNCEIIFSNFSFSSFNVFSSPSKVDLAVISVFK